MAEAHPFTFKIETDPLSERRFRWTVCEGGQIHLRSPHSYATRREAEAEAGKAMLKDVYKRQELNDLAKHSDAGNDDPDGRRQNPRPPFRDVIMLQARCV